MNDLKQQYLEREAAFRSRADRLSRRYNRLAIARLLVFTAGILAAIYCWSIGWLAFTLFTIIFIGAFYRFIRQHLTIKQEEEHCRYLARINQWEAGAIDYDFAPFNAGEPFVDPDHPYSYDLDLFGPHSVFQSCSRATTAIGRQRLAGFLLTMAPLPEISRRQAAIIELATAVDWRQELQAWGEDTSDDPAQLKLLQRWLEQPPFVFGKRSLLLARFITPLIVTVGAGFALYLMAWWPLLLSLVLPVLILRRTLQRVNDTHQLTTHAERILRIYSRLIAHIESRPFTSEKMQAATAPFAEKGKPASRHIRQLSYYIAQLNVRHNFFAIFLNLFALWDLHWVARLERWKDNHRRALPGWFDSLAEIEALSSLANLHYNNPAWAFPNITSDDLLAADGLGHPLIPPDRRIANDLHMPTRSHIKLITGSNMAGKSTFLRTVGLNIVLAMAGAPVCARRLQLPALRVFTSMRTQDALHESTSSFYAELKRLHSIIEAVEQGDHIFFLLDEILKGTNSRDRHTGSKALIRQLIESGGGGLIATHDLELGQLESQYGGRIENLCMEVEIREGQLYFDYKLKKGVSKSFNATLLMKNMGIKV